MKKVLALLMLCGCAAVLAPYLARSQDTGNANPLATTRVIGTASGTDGWASPTASLGFVKMMPFIADVTGANGTTRQIAGIGGFAGTAITAAQANGMLGAAPVLYNGTAFDISRSAMLANYPTAATLTARNSVGVNLFEKGSHFSVVSTPAVSVQATASIALEASVRHVVDCVGFSAGATTAPVLTQLTVNVRDGATGAGTVLWSQTVIIAAAAGQSVPPVTFCGLNLVGTTGTAMTAEYSALLTNLFENVSISGFNVN